MPFNPSDIPTLAEGKGTTLSLKILWMLGASKEARFATRIAEVLEKEHGFVIDMVTPFDSTREALHAVGRDCISVSELIARAEPEFPATAEEQIAQGNRLLNSIDLNMIRHGDSLLYHCVDKRVAQQFIARVALAFHKLIRENDYALCLRYGGGDASGRIPQILLELMGIKTFTISQSSQLDNCGLRPSGLAEHYTWTSFQPHWIANQDRKLTQAEKRTLAGRVQAYYDSHRKVPRTRLEQVGYRPTRNIARAAYNIARLAARQIGYSPTRNIVRAGYNAARLAARWMPGAVLQRRRERAKLAEHVLSGHLEQLVPCWDRFATRNTMRWLATFLTFDYDPVPPPGTYVYLPFNQPWDAPHRFWYPMNYLQEYQARIAVESLPVGYELVIKEHPYTYGEPTHRQLRALQRRGVRVVRPDEHSLELIKNAAAVFCVGDTSGWEAIMLKTPVVIFGAQPFYAAYPYSWTVTDPNDVHHALREAVQMGKDAYADEDAWYRLLDSAYNSVYQGSIWAYKDLVWAKADGSDENIHHVATMIATEAKRELKMAQPHREVMG